MPRPAPGRPIWARCCARSSTRTRAARTRSNKRVDQEGGTLRMTKSELIARLAQRYPQLAAKNVEPVTLRFYFDLAVQAPLVVLLFAFFAIGALFGSAALLGRLLRQRREISTLKRRLGAAPPAEPPPLPEL